MGLAPNAQEGENSLRRVIERTDRMLDIFRSFATDEDGLEMVEWAIVAALITTVTTTALTSLGTSIAVRFGDLATIISSLP